MTKAANQYDWQDPPPQCGQLRHHHHSHGPRPQVNNFWQAKYQHSLKPTITIHHVQPTKVIILDQLLGSWQWTHRWVWRSNIIGDASLFSRLGFLHLFYSTFSYQVQMRRFCIALLLPPCWLSTTHSSSSQTSGRQSGALLLLPAAKSFILWNPFASNFNLTLKSFCQQLNPFASN